MSTIPFAKWREMRRRSKTDPYVVLGVPRDADKSAIRKAYHKLALKHHPDNNDGEGGEKFAEIADAYEVLTDEDKRAFFDKYGIEGDWGEKPKSTGSDQGGQDDATGKYGSSFWKSWDTSYERNYKPAFDPYLRLGVVNGNPHAHAPGVTVCNMPGCPLPGGPRSRGLEQLDSPNVKKAEPESRETCRVLPFPEKRSRRRSA